MKISSNLSATETGKSGQQLQQRLRQQLLQRCGDVLSAEGRQSRRSTEDVRSRETRKRASNVVQMSNTDARRSSDGRRSPERVI